MDERSDPLQPFRSHRLNQLAGVSIGVNLASVDEGVCIDQALTVVAGHED
jgi:hypothetical protein